MEDAEQLPSYTKVKLDGTEAQTFEGFAYLENKLLIISILFLITPSSCIEVPVNHISRGWAHF